MADSHVPAPVQTCRSCGREYPEGRKYCPHCGAPAENSVAPAAGLTCRSCGREYPEGWKYCPHCGAPAVNPRTVNDDFACIYGPPPMPGPSGRRHPLLRLLSKLFHR